MPRAVYRYCRLGCSRCASPARSPCAAQVSREGEAALDAGGPPGLTHPVLGRELGVGVRWRMGRLVPDRPLLLASPKQALPRAGHGTPLPQGFVPWGGGDCGGLRAGSGAEFSGLDEEGRSSRRVPPGGRSSSTPGSFGAGKIHTLGILRGACSPGACTQPCFPFSWQDKPVERNQCAAPPPPSRT